MTKPYFAEKVYQGIDFTEEKFESGDYEFCRFINCQLPKCNLSEVAFIECRFEGGDLSMAKLHGTSIRDSVFNECKLVGLQFDTCNKFSFSAEFESCNLDLSSFFQVKVSNGIFKNCSLQEVDFTNAELKEAIFENCDLARAIFSSTLLHKADFRTSYNFSIHPEINSLKGAKFSIYNLSGLLDQYEIEIE